MDLTGILVDSSIKKRANRIFALFIAGDIVFLVFHILYWFTDILSDSRFSLGRDQGYAEIFQYGKEFWVALSLGILALRLRSSLHLYLGALFGYFLLDDSLKLHETLGLAIADRLGFPELFNLRPRDLGEVVVYASVGLFFFITIATAYLLSDRPARESTKTLFILLGAFLFFGVVLDVVHQMIEPQFWRNLFALLEDGGENFVMSAIVWFTLLLNAQSVGGAFQETLAETTTAGVDRSLALPE